MKREELRDYVDEQRALNNIPYHVYSALIDGIDTLEQEPKAENKGEWIPVSEKLPKDHEEVLIYLSTNRITIGLYNSHVLPFAPYKPIGWGVNAKTAVHNFCSDDVVAWMPLPEVYKAERGE